MWPSARLNAAGFAREPPSNGTISAKREPSPALRRRIRFAFSRRLSLARRATAQDGPAPSPLPPGPPHLPAPAGPGGALLPAAAPSCPAAAAARPRPPPRRALCRARPRPRRQRPSCASGGSGAALRLCSQPLTPQKTTGPPRGLSAVVFQVGGRYQRSRSHGNSLGVCLSSGDLKTIKIFPVHAVGPELGQRAGACHAGGHCAPRDPGFCCCAGRHGATSFPARVLTI